MDKYFDLKNKYFLWGLLILLQLPTLYFLRDMDFLHQCMQGEGFLSCFVFGIFYFLPIDVFLSYLLIKALIKIKKGADIPTPPTSDEVK